MRPADERKLAAELEAWMTPEQFRRWKLAPRPRALTEADHRRLAASACGWCGGPIEYKPRGRIPTWCSAGCRRRAWEQNRAATSGLSAVRVMERIVEVPAPTPVTPAEVMPRVPRHREWGAMLDALAEQFDRGEVYDRDMPEITTALNGVLEAFARHPYSRRHKARR